MKKVLFLFLICLGVSSCSSCSSSQQEPNDPLYYESLGKEAALIQQGLFEAADIERQAREDYMNGGGYTSPNGERQIHYQGSKEQQEDLKKIEEKGW